MHTINSNNLTTRSDWNKTWYSYHKANKILFSDLLNRYLKKDNSYKCIEIGCAPGRYLLYLNRKFGYQIHGVDFTDKKLTEKYLINNGINEYILYEEDFNDFETNVRFDVVCSFGFIEHFRNYEAVFEKHALLLSKGGLLIIELPNFRYAQYFLHRYLDKDNLDKHNTNVMELGVLKNLAEKENLEIIHLNYYDTAGFWTDGTTTNVLKIVLALCLHLMFGLMNRAIKLPNKYLSPYIVLIAKKQEH